MKDLVEWKYFVGFWQMLVGSGIPANDNSHMFNLNIALQTIKTISLYRNVVWGAFVWNIY